MLDNIPWLHGTRLPVIAVVGDVILDEYLEGQVTRISPEAPVPVHLVNRTYQVPGGAANTARNIRFSGGEVAVFSVVGRDDAGDQLRALLRQDGVNVNYLVTVEDRPTIRKTRITASSHQLIRVDWEQSHPITNNAQDQIIKGLRGFQFDALLISDYGKGVLPEDLLREVIGIARERKVPVIVDPKGRDYFRYRGASLITPNRKEACDALGVDSLDDHLPEVLGRELQRIFGLENVLVTLGSKGMMLVPGSSEMNQEAISLPAIAREVYDVSGAGDTVVAIMSLCLAVGTPLVEAMEIANLAAAIVVGKWGTQPVRLGELEEAMQRYPLAGKNSSSSMVKIGQVDQVLKAIKPKAFRSKNVVFTNGCFDILHAGHVTYLEAAKAMGDILIVGVNTDASVKSLKGPSRPIVKLDDRLRVLAGLGCVDYVISFDSPSPIDLIKTLVPDILVKGSDYDKNAVEGSAQAIVGAEFIRQTGGRVETVPLVPGQSTTSIVKRLESVEKNK